MMIDNFNIIRDLITFKKKDNLFFLAQIVKRAKDHPGENIAEGAINTYYIRSKEQFDRLVPEMKLLADFHGARVYINPSPKSMQKLQEMTLTELLRKQIGNELDNPSHVTKSMAGKLKGLRDKQLWVIDIDDDTKQFFSPIMQWLEDNDRSWIIVPTLSFNHILTRPFDIKKFSEEFPEIHVHENSMGTLAYANV